MNFVLIFFPFALSETLGSLVQFALPWLSLCLVIHTGPASLLPAQRTFGCQWWLRWNQIGCWVFTLRGKDRMCFICSYFSVFHICFPVVSPLGCPLFFCMNSWVMAWSWDPLVLPWEEIPYKLLENKHNEVNITVFMESDPLMGFSLRSRINSRFRKFKTAGTCAHRLGQLTLKNTESTKCC